MFNLSLSPRTSNAKETANQLAELLRTQPVDTWKDGIAGESCLSPKSFSKIDKFAELDTPDYMVTFSGIICTLLTLQLSEEQVRQWYWQDVLDISNIPRKRGFFDLIFSLRGWLCRPNPYGCLQPPRRNQNLHVWPVSARGWWENAQNNLAWCCLLSDPPGNCWHQPWHLGEGSISVEHRGHFGQAYICFPLAGKYMYVCRKSIVERALSKEFGI